ncbi:MAG TPA: glycerol-3-phosphate dehydrogenase [Hyphomicrobiaceae bacterium]|nr:glycerol-3-phosphate dehydrogenase [Hyphomicrobiaceae bacterium]
MSESFDLAIIGGGINGCGVARDAAGRGLSVFLCDMGDLGGGTSSRSTKLIHGGLRYLEQFDFRLVREALAEREVIWAIAPHIVRPLRFVLPHQAGLRPAWVLRTGLFLYDHLGGRRRLPPTRRLDLASDAAGRPLKPGVFTTGFEYSDCWVDDARLVVLNARDAAERGAKICARTRAVEASRTREGWQVTLAEVGSGQRDTIAARVLINAAGPWVEAVATVARKHKLRGKVRLVQGSHIVVRQLFGHNRAYILQRPDGRIVFAIPYEGDFTLIGTTDRDYAGDPLEVSASDEEISYLCEAASAAFAQRLATGDVVWSYSGVRPLYDDGVSEAKAASRDYVLELDEQEGAAPLLSIIGGKITTYRRLAEAALARLAMHLPAPHGLPAGWTGTTPLPGGDFAPEALSEIVEDLARAYPFLERAHVLRLAGAYGTRAWRMLGKARSALDLGRQFGATLTEAEVRYLIDQEWAVTAEDVLWRRSKLGLRLSAEEAAQLSAFMGERARAAAMGGG